MLFPPTCAWVFLFRTEIFIKTTAFTIVVIKYMMVVISMMSMSDDYSSDNDGNDDDRWVRW